MKCTLTIAGNPPDTVNRFIQFYNPSVLQPPLQRIRNRQITLLRRLL
ncbi:MAG: hypothetical protein LBT46_09980 [Planctomycetaceae bacterium]|nr:hypothetical protein [Planctomycetaceae bacterium]